MNFKKWVKSIQTAGYNGVRTVIFILIAWNILISELYSSEYITVESTAVQ